MNGWKDSGAAPVKSWCPDIEDGAREQINHAAQLPFAFHHVALMPDAHRGYGAPIGGVLAATNVIVPNFVGMDIGCGMRAARSSLTDIDQPTLKRVLAEIRAHIPVGFNHHPSAQACAFVPGGPIGEREAEAATKQIGTLGGGNHFIEIQHGSDGAIWVMIHSGSRNVGKQTAEHYNDLAVALNEKWHSSIPKDWELAFLPMDSAEGVAYESEMQACMEFARMNREAMMNMIRSILTSITGAHYIEPDLDIHHNYAAIEHHFGRNVWVHRKGATRARAGEMGIIPGSQGTASYITCGLGNPESFQSCSHGAGRKMGRKQAERQLILADEIAALETIGVLHAIRGKGDLDEAPGAYKSITEVMANQTDLVESVVELRPLAVVKG